MHECSTCRVPNPFEGMCNNAKIKLRKMQNGLDITGDALRCKKCEKNDQKIRYYAGKHFGFGANASKSLIWTSLPQPDRLLIARNFRDYLMENYAGDMDAYITATQESPTCALYAGITKHETADDPILRFLKEKHKDSVADIENRQTRIPEGYVYVFSNPAWPGAVKIGSALFWDQRLQSYQTYDPYRAYRLVSYHYARKRKMAENQIHKDLDEHHISGEWFWTSDKIAGVIASVIEEINADPIAPPENLSG